jgi:hypothetical protein
MIQSAMIFALGVFVSGLVWLALSVALVRRARRLTERRLLSGIAMRRAEFESERDELRARHAVQMHRLEREVSRVLDMATAHRLEADLKERDLMNARAELIANDEDFKEIENRLAAEREIIQDLERRRAEAGAALRSAQHTLKLESKRRANAEETLDEMSILAEQRRLAISALRGENDALRARLGEAPGAPVPHEIEPERLPRAAAPIEADEAEPFDTEPLETPAYGGGSVVPLRPKTAAIEAPEPDEGADGEQADAPPQPRMPAATLPAAHNVGELVALRMSPAAEPETTSKKSDESVTGAAENRFFAALAEIRALKRAANQAGE